LSKPKFLVVGAGFAGAVIARELADAIDCHVDVIDVRPHLAGNAYEKTCSETGAKYHVYGPHIFHTNDARIYDYLSRFTEWLPYKHKVLASVEGVGDVPLPVNADTISLLTGKSIANAEELEVVLAEVRVDIPKPENAWEYALSYYGEQVSELFFRRYSWKMWGIDLRDLPVSVLARIPFRTGTNPYYFDDSFQSMPKAGYTSLIEKMLDHPRISVSLNVRFSKEMELGYSHTFCSMPIDEYYGFEFGELGYRSIVFEHRHGEQFPHEVPTVNFTDTGRYTRKTNWDLYPGLGGGCEALVTYETPCDYRENNMERYYPVKTTDGRFSKIYECYRDVSKANASITFIGRCGQYRYFDMHQVVANSLTIARRFLLARG
jgi:UDP-galactopyranose mutase